MVGRFEDFLRDGAPLPALRCSKGQRIVVAAIFKTFSKNHGIGTRTHAGEEWSHRGSNTPGSHKPRFQRLCQQGSRPAESRTPLPTPVFGPDGYEPLLYEYTKIGHPTYTSFHCSNAVILGSITGSICEYTNFSRNSSAHDSIYTN